LFIFVAGKSRARDAALGAIQSPLLDVGIERATGIVWNITGGKDMTLFEVCYFFTCPFFFFMNRQRLSGPKFTDL
jgi:hypothetical protein